MNTNWHAVDVRSMELTENTFILLILLFDDYNVPFLHSFFVYGWRLCLQHATCETVQTTQTYHQQNLQAIRIRLIHLQILINTIKFVFLMHPQEFHSGHDTAHSITASIILAFMPFWPLTLSPFLCWRCTRVKFFFAASAFIISNNFLFCRI